MTEWKQLEHHVQHLKRTIHITLVGKYVGLQDAYISVAEALKHAGYVVDADIDLEMLDSEKITRITFPNCLRRPMALLCQADLAIVALKG